MSRSNTFVEIEKQFEDAMATVVSLYELMWNTEVGSDFRHETIEKIGRGGLLSAKKAERAFHDLMDLYLNEQHELKRRVAAEAKKATNRPLEQRTATTDPLVQRAVNIIEQSKLKGVKS